MSYSDHSSHVLEAGTKAALTNVADTLSDPTNHFDIGDDELSYKWPRVEDAADTPKRADNLGVSDCLTANVDCFLSNEDSINNNSTTAPPPDDFQTHDNTFEESMPPMQIRPRSLTWEARQITAPGGDLQVLINASPQMIWTMFNTLNKPNELVSCKIRSCLTQVYLGYLDQATTMCMLAEAGFKDLKAKWRSSNDWKNLEALKYRFLDPKVGQASNGELQSFLMFANIDGQEEDQDQDDAAKTDQHDATAYLAQEPRLTGYLRTSKSQDDRPQSDYFHPTTDLVSPHSGVSYGADESKHSLVGNLKRPQEYDTYRPTEMSKKRKISDSYDRRYGRLLYDKDSVASDVSGLRMSESPLSTISPILFDDESANTSLSMYDSVTGLLDESVANVSSGRTASNPPSLRVSLPGSQSATYIQSAPITTNGMSSIPPINGTMNTLSNLTPEESATLWLDYNIPFVLQSNPPTTPKDPAAGHAVERARPYILSLKTRLSYLLTTKERKVHTVKQAELQRAVKDVETLWECLRFVKSDHALDGEDDLVHLPTASPLTDEGGLPGRPEETNVDHGLPTPEEESIHATLPQAIDDQVLDQLYA